MPDIIAYYAPTLKEASAKQRSMQLQCKYCTVDVPTLPTLAQDILWGLYPQLCPTGRKDSFSQRADSTFRKKEWTFLEGRVVVSARKPQAPKGRLSGYRAANVLHLKRAHPLVLSLCPLLLRCLCGQICLLHSRFSTPLNTPHICYTLSSGLSMRKRCVHPKSGGDSPAQVRSPMPYVYFESYAHNHDSE